MKMQTPVEVSDDDDNDNDGNGGSGKDKKTASEIIPNNHLRDIL